MRRYFLFVSLLAKRKTASLEAEATPGLLYAYISTAAPLYPFVMASSEKQLATRIKVESGGLEADPTRAKRDIGVVATVIFSFVHNISGRCLLAVTARGHPDTRGTKSYTRLSSRNLFSIGETSRDPRQFAFA